jgi:hypothetical protein
MMMSLLSTCRSAAPAARMMKSDFSFSTLFSVGVSFGERYWANFGARRRSAQLHLQSIDGIGGNFPILGKQT